MSRSTLDILTQFRDRGNEIRLYPLSFAEINSCYENTDRAWEEYVLYGGMPFVVQLEPFKEKSKREALSNELTIPLKKLLL